MMKSLKNLSPRRSPLSETQSLLGRSGKKVGARELAQALPLTSLIDAFSIIVIYLLIGTQGGGLESPVQGLHLPVARNSVPVSEDMAVLKIEKGRMHLNDQLIPPGQLQKKLEELKAQKKSAAVELMVQADQELNYSEIDPLVKAGSLAGIEKLRFAVLPKQ